MFCIICAATITYTPTTNPSSKFDITQNFFCVSLMTRQRSGQQTPHIGEQAIIGMVAKANVYQ
jgi:hypothetical protein